MAKHSFQTEVSQLLQLIVHSLYSHQEIFLRELVSNASDALDKLKFLTLTDDAFKSLAFDPRVEIRFDDAAHTLTVTDTGLGMNEADLIENLGTIARSGTKDFLARLTGDAGADANLIGQFGVGFYACYMVADRVEVLTRRAGEDAAWRWSSDGRGDYEIEAADRDAWGTDVILQLNEAGREFANRWRIESLIKKYSNHIPFPIFLHYEEAQPLSEEDRKAGKEPTREAKTEQVNAASALWRRPKAELTEADYHGFYEGLSHDTEPPLGYVHTHAEGTQQYTTLFYIPRQAPPDLFHADCRPGVKLYVKRVFITDDAKELLPGYLRFVRGVIDSEDLPLNVSREILQQNTTLAAIRRASVKKLLDTLRGIADNAPEDYATFTAAFGRCLKEGLYSDFENRQTLLELVRYKSSKVEGPVSLAEYKARMGTDQQAIYYLTGGNEQTLRQSPLLEAYRQRDLEVLLLDDEIDEIVIAAVPKYGDLELKAINKSGTADDLKSDADRDREEAARPLMDKIQEVLGERVKQVVPSSRLQDYPACIVADENDPTLQMQQVLKAMGREGDLEVKPILEVNPDHPLVVKLDAHQDDATLLEDISHLLLDQALLVEGAAVRQPADFVQRLNRVLESAL